MVSRSARPMRNDIWKYVGLEFVNVNEYAQFYQNIPDGSSDRASFTFVRILASAKPPPKQTAFGNPLR